MTDSPVLVEPLGGDPRITLITLNRPDRKNAYTESLCAELCSALRRFEGDDAARVAVVTGAGDAFCAGGDVRSSEEVDKGEAHPFGHGFIMRDTAHAVVRTLVGLSKPVVAAVNGAAVAGGLTFALACDLRIATASARLGDTSGRLGLLPDEGGAWFFPRAMGLEAALRMSLLGEVYSAEQARELGLVGEVIADDEFPRAVTELATRLADAAPLAASSVKRIMRRALVAPLDHTLEELAMAVDVVNSSEDVTEGVAAFLERRPARFRGA
ncbi:enoyl-CoA hydratase/isomerase family protein [Nocardioides litoris]|uniref:enoyl-CoA hydratase/isomerase family protein n=1 Tax=Nocardioides litoris TaxID=1926648 RepID=UPI0011205BFD|nr:enoyl-CoA hydratase-related protein [Nocardioides litoris]